MNVTCSAEPCPVILDSTCVFYSGANLIYTGITTNDSVEQALIKIDAKFRDAGLGYFFNNGIYQSAPGQPVQLGGSLVTNTQINSNGFSFGLTGTMQASSFITSGGTSSQFVKGDGSLDSNSYQLAGNYITALSGDGVASGPGNAVLTLANVNASPATYGSATRVPIITVNSKGLVTNITTTVITVPSDVVIITGDVQGFGYTGTPFNLTLQNVLATPGVYGSSTFIPVISVNSKGLIVGISQVAIGGGGGLGTVTNVSVTNGTGISASVSNPTTTPNITITNTAPDQTVVLNNGTGISVTGTYPNFTITATGGGGTVTAVTASTPLASTGGNTPNITIQQASGSQDGYLSSTNWTTFNSKQDPISLTTTGTGAATFIANVLNIPTPPTATFTSLTTTGNSGASTLLSGVLNVPTYTLSGLGGQPLATNLTSLSGLTYASTAFVKMTAAGTFALDTNTYLTSAVTSVGATSPITSSGGNTPTISTSMATNKLIGRSSAGVGVMEEITVGTGLSLSAGTLNATAQSVGFEQNFLLMGA
jgi:hypothetical protein